MCLELCRHYGLEYGTIDMAITKDGEYVFFEINPACQYLWLERLTGVPISQALCDLLTNPARNKLN